MALLDKIEREQVDGVEPIYNYGEIPNSLQDVLEERF